MYLSLQQLEEKMSRKEYQINNRQNRTPKLKRSTFKVFFETMNKKILRGGDC